MAKGETQMANTPSSEKKKANRKPVGPKPIFIVIGEGCEILGVFRRAEEVLKILDDNPGAKYQKFMLNPTSRKGTE